VSARPDVLVYADTVRSPELRHEIPLAIGDPFLYAERNGTRRALISAMEQARMGHLAGLTLHAPEEYGFDELIREGKLKRDEIRKEILLRACRAWGIRNAVVPPAFPIDLADYLRAQGIEITPDRELFRMRRRAKNEHELAGVRRAQKAADAGMAAARELLRRTSAAGGRALLDGEPLTSERLKRAIEDAFSAHDCTAEEFIVSHGEQSAIGHHMGAGEIAAGEPIVIDIWPKDRESGCYADMTRTFVVGEPPEELRQWHTLCVQALEAATAQIAPGVRTSTLDALVCELFEQHGLPTQRTKEEGKPLEDGYYHSLGHGVGLEVHEDPALTARLDEDELMPGDVVTVEPGLYRKGWGGCRVEDLILVTEDGHEVLTDFPYNLKP
jgi:Xaa-Pro aminopeptidase